LDEALRSPQSTGQAAMVPQVRTVSTANLGHQVVMVIGYILSLDAKNALVPSNSRHAATFRRSTAPKRYTAGAAEPYKTPVQTIS
jgi:hypothetical protein